MTKSQEVQMRNFERMAKFFDGRFRLWIMQEADPENKEWVLPASYFDWRQRTNQPAGTKWTSCPEDEIIRTAKLSDLNKCAKYQRDTNRSFSILFSPALDVQDFYIMLDDVKAGGIEKHKATDKVGRLIIESSPGNYQVWIRLKEALSGEERVELMRAYSPDVNAATAKRSGRMPGFANKKEKYREIGFPWSKLTWVRYGATTPEEIGTVCTRIERPPKPVPVRTYGHKDYVERDHSTICWQDYNRKDDSATDFAFGLALRSSYEWEIRLNCRVNGEIDETEFRRQVEARFDHIAAQVASGIRHGRQDWKAKGGEGSPNVDVYIQRTVNNIMATDLSYEG